MENSGQRGDVEEGRERPRAGVSLGGSGEARRPCGQRDEFGGQWEQARAGVLGGPVEDLDFEQIGRAHV